MNDYVDITTVSVIVQLEDLEVLVTILAKEDAEKQFSDQDVVFYQCLCYFWKDVNAKNHISHSTSYDSLT